MARLIDTSSAKERNQKVEHVSSKKALSDENFPIEVLQLLDVLTRIEMRRQVRLNELEKEAS